MVGICTGLALSAGSNPLTVVTVRTLCVILLLIAYFRMAGVSIAMSRRDRLIAIQIGFLLSLTTYLLNSAIAEIPVPLAVLIFYLWPALTTCASWALGKERFRWRLLFGLLLAFAGIGLSLNVDFSAAQWKGVALAVGSSLAWSATFLLTGHFFHARDTRPATFTMVLTMAAVFAVLCAITGAVALPSTAAGWTALASMPVFYAFALIGLFAGTVTPGAAENGVFL